MWENIICEISWKKKKLAASHVYKYVCRINYRSGISELKRMWNCNLMTFNAVESACGPPCNVWKSLLLCISASILKLLDFCQSENWKGNLGLFLNLFLTRVFFSCIFKRHLLFSPWNVCKVCLFYNRFLFFFF